MISISSFLHSLSRTVFVIGATLAFMSAVANEEVWDVKILMQRLSEVSHAEIDFVETKKSILLVTNVTLAGKMDYRAPDFIEKITESPFYEKVVINGDSMVVEKTVKLGKDDEIQQLQEFSVDSNPLLKAAVESIRAMLAGNFELLTENYILQLDGERNAWQLSLVPKSSEILEYIEQINLTGADTEIRKVVTIQADGDESKLELTYQLLELSVN